MQQRFLFSMLFMSLTCMHFYTHTISPTVIHLRAVVLWPLAETLLGNV